MPRVFGRLIFLIGIVIALAGCAISPASLVARPSATFTAQATGPLTAAPDSLDSETFLGKCLAGTRGAIASDPNWTWASIFVPSDKNYDCSGGSSAATLDVAKAVFWSPNSRYFAMTYGEDVGVVDMDANRIFSKSLGGASYTSFAGWGYHGRYAVFGDEYCHRGNPNNCSTSSMVFDVEAWGVAFSTPGCDSQVNAPFEVVFSPCQEDPAYVSPNEPHIILKNGQLVKLHP